MSKKDKRGLIDFLQKREKVILNFSQSVSLKKSAPVKRNGVNIDSNGFEMILKISTDTLSPLQKGYFNETWDEIIDRNCFDSAIKEKKELFCFLDHNIDIANTLASTRNNTLTFEKSTSETAYLARVKLDENNEQHKDLISKVKSGLVNSNSFIFIPQDVEYRENSDGESDVTVIHKRGELISIDPVIMPFYPTNEIQFTEKERKDQNMELENKDLELKESDDTDKETSEDKDLEEKETQTPEDKETDDAETPEEKETEKPEKKNLKNFKVTKKGTKVEIEYEGLSDEEIDKKISELLDAKKTEADNNEIEDTAKADTPPVDKNMDGEEIESETDKKRSNQIIKNNGVIKKMNDILKSEKPNSLTTRDVKNIMLKKSLNTWNKGIDVEIADAFLSRVDEIIKNDGIDEQTFLQGINNCSAALNLKNRDELKNMLLSRGGIDGSGYATGLAYISIINDPEVKTELERTLPEIAGADFIQLDNLDIVQKDLLIPSSAVVASVKEGIASTAFNGTTVSIKFNPVRYALEHQANIKLPNFSQVLEKDTLNGKNAIVTALRVAFYKNLVQHKDVTFASLQTTEKSDYLGGITKDSLLSSSDTTKLQISDFDNLINTLESKYGTDEVKNKFVFLMHPNTRSFLFTNLRTQYNAVWVANASQNTFRDIPIVTAPMFPGSVNAVTGVASSGTLAFILCRKDTIAVRGFNFIIEDNPYISMTSGLATRYQNTRGEMKLYDPYINTYSLQVGNVTQYTIEKLATLSDQELIDLHNDEALFKTQDKETKKEIVNRVREIEKQTK